MTRSSEDNMNAVAAEVNHMDVDYGKNFKILSPNFQIKGECEEKAHFPSPTPKLSFQSSRQSYATRTRTEATSSSTLTA